MEKPDRSQQIRVHLGIEPISHGQIYTFQIAVPESQKHDISLERYQVLADSLTNHKTNLLPLIVRRTEAYSEEEEYEVVSGADWCIVAKERNIEKLWVWFFDMNDEQAAAAQAEMEQLVGNVMLSAPQSTEIEILLDKKLQPITAKFDQLTAKVDQLLQNKPVAKESEDKNGLGKGSGGESKLNLRLATQTEIEEALTEVKVKPPQRKAAWKAIQYWQKTGKYLNWENLKKSTKRHSADDVPDFTKGVYDKLKEIAHISDEDVA